MSHSLVILKSPTARCLAFHDAFLGVTGSGFAAAMWGFRMLLPLAVESWWCETSAQTGCRGHSRHFVREISARNPFLAFGDIKTARKDDAIVVDWDSDGDWDVILRTTTELLLFESKPGGKFVRVEPNPFKGIPSNPFSSFQIGDCMPAVVDWDRDGKLDLIIGAKDRSQGFQISICTCLLSLLSTELGAELFHLRV